VRILITGNMGYVGSVLVHHLRAVLGNVWIIGYDAGLFAHCLTNSAGLPETLLDLQVFGDIRDFPSALLEGIDAVVHLAALSNDPMGNRYSEATLEVNSLASVRIAERARDAGVKSFVFASSCSVYGQAGEAPRCEGDRVNPLTAYAKSKVATEDALRQMDLAAMTVSCLRFATACGMSPRLRLDLVLNDFVACAKADKKITVLSDGTPWRPLIDVADMARAIAWAIQRDTTQGGPCLVVNVGSNEWNYRVLELADAVAAAIPDTATSVNTNAPADRRSYRVDFSLFRALAPAHQPQVSLERSISAMRDGLEVMGFADSEFRRGPLIRLCELDRLMAVGRITAEVRVNRTVPTMAT